MADLVQLTHSPQQVRDDFWVLARSACYLGGRGVTFGPPLLGMAAINPGVYSIPFALHRLDRVAAQDDSLQVIAAGSLDHVLVTPMIAAMANPRTLLEQAAQKLRTGGHLVLLTSLTRLAPEHVEFEPEGTKALMRELAHWRLKLDMVENGKHLLVLKKVEGRRGLDPIPASDGRPRACVARYGALGDAIVLTPLLRRLHEDGYHVTLQISSYCAPVFENNPYIDNLLIQARDLIPNQLLGRYWEMWEGEYDRYINLSESMEGDLLVVENRAPFYTTKAWRHQRCNKNYYDYTMARGGYPEATGTRGELFFTAAEERRAQKFFGPLRDKFTIVWALNGSSHHKVYPMMEPLLREWLTRHEDARVVTTGDVTACQLEFGHWQVIPMAAKWSIRESLIATKYAQCVVGPETMMTNAAGCFATPKIIFLSHSSQENLTKYFINCHAMEPDQAHAPCYPCHQLHYTKESCPCGEMQDTNTGEVLGHSPICSISISPERVMDELDSIYNTWRGVCAATA